MCVASEEHGGQSELIGTRGSNPSDLSNSRSLRQQVKKVWVILVSSCVFRLHGGQFGDLGWLDGVGGPP